MASLNKKSVKFRLYGFFFVDTNTSHSLGISFSWQPTLIIPSWLAQKGDALHDRRFHLKSIEKFLFFLLSYFVHFNFKIGTGIIVFGKLTPMAIGFFICFCVHIINILQT
jgi:uncharacterized membrane protein YozB (DUF420 family)